MINGLSALPRAHLAQLPTPLDNCPRAAERLGAAALLVKRDDLTSTGLGGNKIRKLEFLLGEAMAAGADTVITFGAVQSNHARQTAAACAKLGLRCELVLTEMVPRETAEYTRSGNVLLDWTFGARVHVCADSAAADETHQRLLAEADAEGRTVRTLPVGGSNVTGVYGYVTAAAELVSQLADAGEEDAHVVVPGSSGGTAAGLLLGSSLLGWRCRIHVACVSHTPEETAEIVERLAAEAATALGVRPPASDAIRFDAARGEGYGVPDDGTWEAIRTLGAAEGLALDPVYTGKAAAALTRWLAAGELAADQTVVFLHTGGSPALFGYAAESGLVNSPAGGEQSIA